jgi:hypothetical protein
LRRRATESVTKSPERRAARLTDRIAQEAEAQPTGAGAGFPAAKSARRSPAKDAS